MENESRGGRFVLDNSLQRAVAGSANQIRAGDFSRRAKPGDLLRGNSAESEHLRPSDFVERTRYLRPTFCRALRHDFRYAGYARKNLRRFVQLETLGENGRGIYLARRADGERRPAKSAKSAVRQIRALHGAINESETQVRLRSRLQSARSVARGLPVSSRGLSLGGELDRALSPAARAMAWEDFLPGTRVQHNSICNSAARDGG